VTQERVHTKNRQPRKPATSPAQRNHLMSRLATSYEACTNVTQVTACSAERTSRRSVQRAPPKLPSA
jgi:hypothetical protein